MSKKRKQTNRQRGGRYTPPRGRAAPKGFPPPPPTRLVHSPTDVDGFGFENDEDDRSPVTISLPEYGNWTVPLVFASWLDDEDQTAHFDDFICRHREANAAADVLEAFIQDRDDVPSNVREAVAGYSDYLDEYFGPPV